MVDQLRQQALSSKSSHAAQFDRSWTIFAVSQHLGCEHVYAVDQRDKILNEGKPLSVLYENVPGSGAQRRILQEEPRLSHFPDAVVVFTYNEDTDVISKNGNGNKAFHEFTEVCKAKFADYENAPKKSNFVQDLLKDYSIRKGARFFHYHAETSYPTLHSHLDKFFVDRICNKFRGIRRKMKAEAAAATAAAATAAAATAAATATATAGITVPDSAAAVLQETAAAESSDRQSAIPTFFPDQDERSIDLDSFDLDLNDPDKMWQPTEEDQGESFDFLSCPYALQTDFDPINHHSSPTFSMAIDGTFPENVASFFSPHEQDMGVDLQMDPMDVDL